MCVDRESAQYGHIVRLTGHGDTFEHEPITSCFHHFVVHYLNYFN